MTEIQFLLNEKKRRYEIFIFKAKFTLFLCIFTAVIITNFDRYSSPKANSNDYLMLGMWLLYPIYLFLFHHATMKRFTLQCSKCKNTVQLNNDYRETADLKQLQYEQCNSCENQISLESL